MAEKNKGDFMNPAYPVRESFFNGVKNPGIEYLELCIERDFLKGDF